MRLPITLTCSAACMTVSPHVLKNVLFVYAYFELSPPVAWWACRVGCPPQRMKVVLWILEHMPRQCGPLKMLLQSAS